jgi:hypothetical protein
MPPTRGLFLSLMLGLCLPCLAAPLAITGPSLLQDGREQEAYSPVTFTASGGSGGYTWSASGLPSGLSMSAGGALAGTPATGTSGSYSLTIMAADSSQQTASLNLTLRIFPNLQYTFPAPLPPGQVGVPYSFTLSVGGGRPPYSWSGSGLPPGLTLGPSGTLSGTPTAPGSFEVFMFVLDATRLGGAQRAFTSPLPLLQSRSRSTRRFHFQMDLKTCNMTGFTFMHQEAPEAIAGARVGCHPGC